jgi:hypothetical protein
MQNVSEAAVGDARPALQVLVTNAHRPYVTRMSLVVPSLLPGGVARPAEAAAHIASGEPSGRLHRPDCSPSRP